MVDDRTWAERDHTARIEARLSRSPDLLRDPRLQHYIESLTRSLLTEGRAPPRIYLLDRESAQADLHGDDVLRINLGLLVRLRSEAELAFVLAHELAHRELGHWNARRSGSWDPSAAEIAADEAALRKLVSRGYAARTGSELLRRLAEHADDVELTRLISARADALERASAPAEASSGGTALGVDEFADTFDTLITIYRSRVRE